MYPELLDRVRDLVCMSPFFHRKCTVGLVVTGCGDDRNNRPDCTVFWAAVDATHLKMGVIGDGYSL